MDTSKDFDWGSLFGSFLGNIGPLYGLGRTISGNGLPSMGEIINYGREAGALADPFATQRAQYQQQLQQLMADPSSIQGTPGYQFRLGQGVNALDRSAAAKGMLHSGNQLYDLENYAQGLASTEYDNQLNRLMTLSGATTGSPAAAGQALMQGVGSGYNMQDDRYGDMMEALAHLQGGQNGNILGALGGLLGQGASGLTGLLGQGMSGISGLLGRLFGDSNYYTPPGGWENFNSSMWDPNGYFSNELNDLQDMGTMFQDGNWDPNGFFTNELSDLTDMGTMFQNTDWSGIDWGNFDWSSVTDWSSFDWGDIGGWF